MKKIYAQPELDLLTVDLVDVIRTSGKDGDCYKDDNFVQKISKPE